MKKNILYLCMVVVFAGIEVHADIPYAETIFNIEKNRLLEIARSGTLPNGCESAGTPKALIDILDCIDNGGACNQHDMDYHTQGMQKDKADSNFYINLLKAGVPDFLALHFFITVSILGQNAYDSAQLDAKKNKKNDYGYDKDGYWYDNTSDYGYDKDGYWYDNSNNYGYDKDGYWHDNDLDFSE